MQDLNTILEQAILAINSAKNPQQLENVRVTYLGKKGHVTGFLKNVGKLPATERPKVGQEVNKVKQKIIDEIAKHKELLADKIIGEKISTEQIDISLPARCVGMGNLHPVTKVFDKLTSFFISLGFSIADGPEIEDEYHNFEALNIPSHHPARDLHDTFYFADQTLLRTHISPVQIRTMKGQKPPLRIIAPGRVYRCDSDITHTPMFHQLEGFMVDEDINFGHLKGILTNLLQTFFEKKLDTRFRASYFPFTEPSAEVDMQCVICEGSGCRVCKNTGWLEILGCGMVHPVVLENCEIDSERYTGFAFGMGMDRLAMLKYGISDLRILFENDIRFLEQF